ncbi:MAG: MurR/RpiR family transcriptional regulator [Solobacterium sp.]|nr:MurR/RpiR family transcriptional regulator [Solobacterium sp.]
MDVILAKIIKYLNGCMYYDMTYIILKWMLDHYIEMDEDSFSMENLMKDTGASEEDVHKVLRGLEESEDFEAFKKRLWQYQSIRLDQIRARMIGLSLEDIMQDMEKNETDAEMRVKIEAICDCLDRSKRIFLVGAVYPMAIATEFQTDLNIFGKDVQQYHAFDKTLKLDENDMLILISATGRSAEYFIKNKKEINPSAAKSLIITQNRKYDEDEFRVSDFTIILPGRFDGINGNYQVMKIFDLLRLSYYQRYYLG